MGMFMLSILFVSKSYGMASNSLLMSIVVRIVHFGGFLLLRASKVFSVGFVRRVLVE